MTSPGPLPYRIVDVFAATAYAGNPLAVVLDGAGLSTAAMQAMAREFNLSETVFPMAAGERAAGQGADYLARIFTPTAELPFAGHPSVGCAWVMRQEGRVPKDARSVVQECGAGLLRLDFFEGDGDVIIRLTGGPPTVGEPQEPGPLLDAAQLEPADLVDPGTPPRWCGAGIDFCFLRVTDQAVARVEPDIPAVGRLGGAGLVVFSWDPAAAVAHARVFAAGAGVPEDPATGSAAIALGFWLAASGLVDADGPTSYAVRQGAEMGRPSLLRGEVVTEAGRPVSGSVAGTVVPVAEGTIRPPAI